MLAFLFPRPSSPESYQLGQDLNLIFGVVVVVLILLAAIGWAIDRWRTRNYRGKHAALHRVRARKSREP